MSQKPSKENESNLEMIVKILEKQQETLNHLIVAINQTNETIIEILTSEKKEKRK